MSGIDRRRFLLGDAAAVIASRASAHGEPGALDHPRPIAAAVQRDGLGGAVVGDFIHAAGGGPVMGGGVQSAVHEAFTLG